MMYKYIAIFCLLFSPAFAQTADDAHFKDWLKLADYLRSNNISPVHVSWAVIEPLCLPLKTSSDETEYNRCKFNRAVDERDFFEQRDECIERAKANYPNYLINRYGVVSYVKDKNGNDIPITGPLPADGEQVEFAKHSSAISCMKKLGWRNAENWLKGRNEGAIGTTPNITN